jgi:CelD/BcsL family acetyltransferase involved in cellulose biosynthesis
VLDWFRSGEAGAQELCLPGICGVAELGEAIAAPCLREEKSSPAFRLDLRDIRASDNRLAPHLSANARQQLAQSMRACRAIGPLALEEARTTEEAFRFFDGLKDLHVRSWIRRSRPHAFVHPFFESFHRALIARSPGGADVQLLRLTAGSRTLGFLYNLRRTGRIYAYQSGFDDTDPRLRPGYVAHALAIELNSAAGAVCYDFLAGWNRLKERFGTDKYTMEWHTIQQPLMRFRAEHALRRAKHALASLRRPNPGEGARKGQSPE